MKLSPGEKLILMTLAAAKDGKEEIDLGLVRSAILSGNTWALTWEFSGIASEDVDPQVAEETAEILSMWRVLRRAMDQLSEAERDRLKLDVYPYDLEFEGFDGNHDQHHGVASFLVENLGRFDELKDKGLNSHSQASLPHYRRMLSSYRAVLDHNNYSTRSLTFDQLKAIIKGD